MREENKGLQTVHRTIQVLKCFTQDEPELTLRRITEKTKLPKTTTYRIIETLIETDILQKSEHKYKLGYTLYLLGKVAEKSNDIIKLASPIMEKLRDDTTESVALYKIEDDMRLCIHRFPSKQAISHHIDTGIKQRIDIGASGKAMLAFTNTEKINRILYEQESEERKEFLIQDLGKIRQDYISYSFNERGAGVNAISSPVFNMGGEISYALSLSGPSIRFTEDNMEKWIDRIRNDATQISKLLGCDKSVYYTG